MSNPNTNQVTTSPASSPASFLNAWDQRTIRNAMARTPFSADTRVPSPPSGHEIDVAAIVTWIEGLADVLREHSEQTRQQLAEADALRRDVAAVRRLLGLGK